MKRYFGLLSSGLLMACLTLSLSGCAGGAAKAMAQPAMMGNLKQSLPDTVAVGKPVILDFGAKFCLACQLIHPKLEKLVAKTPALTLKTYDLTKLDTAGKTLKAAFGVTTAPTVVFLSKSGRPVKIFYEDVPEATLQKTADTTLHSQ